METSNEYYGRINIRFEERATLLLKNGYQYEQGCADVAVFSKLHFGKTRNIAAALVLLADDRVWKDQLQQIALRQD